MRNSVAFGYLPNAGFDGLAKLCGGSFVPALGISPVKQAPHPSTVELVVTPSQTNNSPQLLSLQKLLPLILTSFVPAPEIIVVVPNNNFKQKINKKKKKKKKKC